MFLGVRGILVADATGDGEVWLTALARLRCASVYEVYTPCSRVRDWIVFEPRSLSWTPIRILYDALRGCCAVFVLTNFIHILSDFQLILHNFQQKV